MDESTTTNEPIDTGVEQTQPADVDTQAAENQPTEPVSTNDSQSQAVSQDDNLAWLQNKGIDPTSPEALAKVAEMYRNAEKSMHSKAQEKAQLQQALQQPVDHSQVEDFGADPVDALQAQVQALVMKDTVNSFWQANPDAKQYEGKMTEIVQGRPEIGQLVQSGYLSMKDLYSMALGSDPSRETTLKSEGGREALQKVADKQQAKAVTPQASSSAMSQPGVTRENFDSWYSGLSSTQRQSKETQNIVASLF